MKHNLVLFAGGVLADLIVLLSVGVLSFLRTQFRIHFTVHADETQKLQHSTSLSFEDRVELDILVFNE